MLTTRSVVASTIFAAAAALTVAPLGTAVADDPKPKPPSAASSAPDSDTAPRPSRDAVAAVAAADIVTARVPQLHLSRYDKVHAQETLRSAQLRFVPYERTYRGLPVDGGDFVVVVDGDGNVVYTSVAQTAKVSLADVQPSVAATTARTRSAGKVNDARLGRSQLVVLQRGSRSDLAWRTTATGRRAGEPSRLDVYVDADSGEVLQTLEGVASGDGNAGWSGPNPVPIQTRKVGSTYEMTMKTAPTMTCQDLATNLTFTGPDDVWGNGDPTNKETACVDALYGAQQMNKMMASWLGRAGMNGSNGWLPMRVGLAAQNAFYDGTQVQFGFNPSGQWVSSLDVTAHEFGHGVDHHTPGGISRGSTQEFIADTFGTSTEWFDNQPAPHDVRDFLIGEEINLAGHNEIRNMANPSLEGHPNCYSPAMDTSDQVHANAGPGDHWFYIASQGTNPASGPVSPTCNATTQLGIGIQKVMKVLYTAMLMKTTASSYPRYRAWTLIAARHLYGQANCTEFNRIRAAWNAVSVPAQGDEGTCTKNAGGAAVTNATARTATAGSPFTPFTMTATGGTAPYTWSALGLPTGLSINPSTGQVSGTLNKDTAGTWVVEVTATPAAGAAGKAWFTFYVASPTTPACSGQRLGNSDFELPSDAPWTTFAGKIGPHGASLSRTGVKHAWLGGYGSGPTNHLGTRIDTLTQSVTVPAGCKATLVFYVWSLTDEDSSTTGFDTLTVKAGNTTLLTRSNLDAINVEACGSCPKTYAKVTKVLPGGLAGTTFELSFNTNENDVLFTNWHIDDVTLKISPP
ncbi:M4 family metallopeptidase [Nocardioides sp. HM23]|uniref:M4 family metallopeptidase n=1 Tax=Nocardioides bizhenqiangii TaxID=3095076 RepID=UPI002ACA2E86|nr:M4 family metallopeptidase [Nocardioides sp. HM23]MDZ5623322.1 M4 family metallopeptidase [Nocardioides sp. HM23]